MMRKWIVDENGKVLTVQLCNKFQFTRLGIAVAILVFKRQH